ncbi:hypothetical protein LCGC14_2191150 [marine sediment metagenome]|uniref:Uncharacterized protein n=1 Tax=marine sediment metagenome TaxID=412755 RepID=A0A0F9E6L6_9ZZZZ
MSEDRLEQIRRDWEENYGMALANGDIDWFISEGERLRDSLQICRGENAKRCEDLQEVTRMAQDYRNRAWEASEKDATIATLRGKIEKAIGKLNWMLAPGQTRKEAVEILTEALATPAKEDSGERQGSLPGD